MGCESRRPSKRSSEETCEDVGIGPTNELPELVDVVRTDVRDIRNEISSIAFGVRVLLLHVELAEGFVDLSEDARLVLVDVTDANKVDLVGADGSKVDFREVDRAIR